VARQLGLPGPAGPGPTDTGPTDTGPTGTGPAGTGPADTGPTDTGALDALLTELSGRRLLLILDTCEHLIDACAELAEAILLRAPFVTVLATSREPLDIDGEITFPIRPLPVPPLPVPRRPVPPLPVLRRPVPPRPEPGAAGTGEDTLPFGVSDTAGEHGPGGGAETAAGGDAVELFARRAAAAVPGFAVTDANRGDVIRVCQRLDGIPLAIELAALRLRALSPGELAARLGRRLPLLTGGDAADPRHRTLRDAVGWSYRLCTDAERTLWARLSVFAGAFSIDAALEVCGGDALAGDDVFETVIRLVDKSVLVRVQPAIDGAPEWDQPAWYRMPGAVAEFGGEVLRASGDETEVRARFAARYLTRARYFAAHLTDPGQRDKFRELRREHGSIQAALGYLLDAEPRHGEPRHGEPQPGGPQASERRRQGAELAIDLCGYWHMAGLPGEGRRWYARVLETLPDTSPARGWVLACRGYLGAVQGDAAEAVADATAGTRIGIQLGDDRLVGRGRAYLVLALAVAGQAAEAAATAAKAEQKLAALGDRTGLAILDCHQAYLAQVTGDIEGAVRHGARAVSRFRGAREWWATSWAYVLSATALYWQPGGQAAAARTASRALLLKHELGDLAGMAYCLKLHGWLAARAGRHERAAWLLGAADPLWRRADGRLGGAALDRVHRESVAAGRAALGTENFDSLYARGASAPPDVMVAFAVAEAETPDGHVPPIPQPGRLTDREWEIAYLAAAGLSADQIARQLFVSVPAVEEYLASVFGKLSVSSADQLRPWVADEPAAGIPVRADGEAGGQTGGQAGGRGR
ncbi:MAG TPA: LuxR C-terminal-related transcriptional regulator, partial [Trebonia sp.]|nr:LuxR C-terminal-related transcriptional regulator [Trebonia sp.]